MFTPSKYQTDIYNWVESNPVGSDKILTLVIDAKAGSGKTTVLVEISKQVKGNAIFLAFNAHIRDELKTRLSSKIRVSTIHSLGMQTLIKSCGKFRDVDKYKYSKICKDIVNDYFLKNNTVDLNKFTLVNHLKTLTDFCRLSLTNPQSLNAVAEMVVNFSLEIEDFSVLFPLINLAITEGNNQAKLGKVIDFTDQIYLPWQWNLQPNQYDWTLTDESQDLNSAQLSLVMKCVRRGGRRVFVGDPFQSIYQFAGANCDSIQQIIEATQATVLPLSVCYRCPKSHIALAQKLVPEIEAAPNAIDGELYFLKYEELFSNVREGDLIISRKTSPLVKLCIQLISRRIPASVKGRDIGKQLGDVIDDVSELPGFTYRRFGEFLERYREDKISKLMQRENPETLLESLNDRVDAIQVCYESFDECEDIQCLKFELQELFSDTRTNVLLAVVHRVKGLEEKRVMVLDPSTLPLVWKNQSDDAFQQELNLCYVSRTRAKETLFFVEAEKKKEKAEAVSVSRFEIGESDIDF